MTPEQIKALEEKLAIAVEALEFYKKGINYSIQFTTEDAFGAAEELDLWYDKPNCYRVGARAIKALEKIQGK